MHQLGCVVLTSGSFNLGNHFQSGGPLPKPIAQELKVERIQRKDGNSLSNLF